VGVEQPYPHREFISRMSIPFWNETVYILDFTHFEYFKIFTLSFDIAFQMKMMAHTALYCMLTSGERDIHVFMYFHVNA
jgi:hypothetical protein